MCDCGKIDDTPVSGGIIRYNEFNTDPIINQEVVLEDGRRGTIDDVIRNGKSAVIGYVVETAKGKVRVFKDKVTLVNEMEGPPAGSAATLDTVTGQGSAQMPSRDNLGSGDAFPSLGMGLPSGSGQSYAKKSPKKKVSTQKTAKKKEDTIPSFNEFLKRAKKMQG